MAYTYSTFAQVKSQLAERLGDASKVFWVDTELGLILTQALRTSGLLTGFWRERGVMATSQALPFYDIASGLPSLLGYTITDYNIIQQLQYYLLESASSQSVWTGTEMFTLASLSNAIQNRRNQFLADTGIVVNRSIVNVLSPPIGREQLNDVTIDVRRAAWLGASPLNYYVTLWREDERLLTAADQSWSVTAGTPEAYSIMAPPPLQLQLSPIPISSGQLELLTVDAGADLSPSSAATILGIPDDLTPGITWGALSDLLGQDGIARDPARAQFAEAMYQQYVQYGRMLPVVIHAEINGVPLIPCTLQELESSTPLWENTAGQPSDIALAAPNMIALNSVPDGTYSVTMDVVRRTPIPANDGSFIQIGREQLDMLLDYAEHLALFKVAGAEWKATLKHASSFLTESLTYNQRLSAAARSALVAGTQSQMEKQETRRRLNQGQGFGVLTNAGS